MKSILSDPKLVMQDPRFNLHPKITKFTLTEIVEQISCEQHWEESSHYLQS